MTSRDFCYWLQGFFEINGIQNANVLYPQQVNIIQNHLNLVFKHEIDPSFKLDKKTELEYQALHDGTKPNFPGRNEHGELMRC